WDRSLASLGRAPYWFTISGGEPFMLPFIVELAQLVYQHCRPGIINIPTNSILYKRIPAKVAAICESCPETQIVINLSLDGVGADHDRIRGIPGNFEKFEANFKALRELDYPNLTIGIHSVISVFNVKNVIPLFDYALSSGADQFITEIAEPRVELDTYGLDITPSLEDYAVAIDELIRRVQSSEFKGLARITEAFRLEYYKLVKRIMAEATQVIGCYAGWASAQIYANGDVWPCCIRADPLGNLREVGYDFKKIWFSSDVTKQVRRSIYKKECYCPLANASYTNMLLHTPTLFRVGMKLVKP
ncbi:MAG: radical SAM protein, partial [Candidatus Hadarchaeum sp.]